MRPAFLKRPKRELLQLLVLLALPLGIPLLLPPDPDRNDDDFPREPFRQDKLDQVLKIKPDVVLIGNSMLNTRVDKRLFADLAEPNRVAYVAEGGTRSLVWYFMLKNFAAIPEPPPKLVFVFFRDFDFNSPGMNLTGEWLMEARSYMKPDDEPLLERARAMEGIGPDTALDNYLPDLLAMETRRKIAERAMDVAAAGSGTSHFDVKVALAERFEFDDLRPDVFDAGALENDAMPLDRQLFSTDPGQNLLSLFSELAKSRGIRLCFYRVKRRPDEQGRARQSDALDAYLAAFREWAESEGHLLLDETDDPRLTLDMYHDGDHLAKHAMEEYTRLFFERVKHVLPKPPAAAASAAAP